MSPYILRNCLVFNFTMHEQYLVYWTEMTKVIMLQYCAKVTQTIIVEYRTLFFRYFAYISAIYHAYWRHVRTIIRRDIGAPLRYLADVSFQRNTATAISRRARDMSLRYIVLAKYRYSDISWSERCVMSIHHSGEYRHSELSLSERYGLSIIRSGIL